MPIQKTSVAVDKWQYVKNVFGAALGEFSKKMVGREREFKALFAVQMSAGSAILEGPAGTGKTEVAKDYASLEGQTFRRIQFTPDLMPASITGGHIFNQKTSDFEFREGPIFANIVLGDEINRASPKTQAALLEALAELQVSSNGETFKLPSPFMFIATQNPSEYEGTFPLPLNQEDRFLMWIPVRRLTDPSQLAEVARRNINGSYRVKPMLDEAMINSFRDIRKEVTVVDAMYDYMARIIGAVNEHPSVDSGPGERAMIALTRISQANAMIEGHSAVSVADVRVFAENVLMHRTRLRDDVPLDITVESVLSEIIPSVKAPKLNRN